jgi:hypothetical protein
VAIYLLRENALKLTHPLPKIFDMMSDSHHIRFHGTFQVRNLLTYNGADSILTIIEYMQEF